jgi:hypothetical protein
MQKELLVLAGIPQIETLPLLWKDEELIRECLSIFSFLFHENDPRWALVAFELEASHRSETKPIHHEVALSAYYLSAQPSYRNQYGRFTTEANLLQLSRSVVNLWHWPEIRLSLGEILDSSSLMKECCRTRVVRTTRITRGKNADNITGCPEALYQLQLFYNEAYVGRIGFNLHVEGTKLVISIANIQGATGAKELHNKFRNKYKTSVFNQLVKIIKQWELSLTNQGLDVEVRGLENPKNGNSQLYQSVFENEGIPLYPRHVSNTELISQM